MARTIKWAGHALIHEPKRSKQFPERFLGVAWSWTPAVFLIISQILQGILIKSKVMQEWEDPLMSIITSRVGIGRNLNSNWTQRLDLEAIKWDRFFELG